jgi:RNA polymerase sigma factor (sigma-70 family)
LYARHSRLVAGLCRALLRDRAEAEDAAQQVFLSAHRAYLNGADPREPAAWLATIARHECWARIGDRMREPLPAAAAAETPAPDDPVADAIRRADLVALWTAVGALPAQQREALLLREFGGLRYDELAAAVGVSGPAVESLLFRARRRLRAQLDAAYAAVTGGAWLEPLVRWIAGAGAPAAATKAIAVGLGTAAVTGSAVAVPDVVERQHAPPRLTAAAVVVKHPVAHVNPVAPAAVATPPAPVSVQQPVAVRHEVVHRRVHHHAAERPEVEHAAPVAPPATTAASAVEPAEIDVQDAHDVESGHDGSSGSDD